MAFSLVKAPTMPGPDDKCFLLQGSKGTSGVLCPPASSFSPEAGLNQNISSGPPCRRPSSPYSSPSLLTPPPSRPGRPKQPEAGTAGLRASGRATCASPVPASSQADLTMAPFTRGRRWPLWSPRGDVPGPRGMEEEVRNSGRGG